MGNVISRTLSTIGVPAVVLIGMVMVTQTAAWGQSLGSLKEVAPALVTGIAVLLGLRFNRSRVILAAVGLAALSWLMEASFDSARGQVFFNGALILAPLYMAAFAVMAERGFVTTRAVINTILVAIPLGGLAWIAHPKRAHLAAHLEKQLVDPGWVELLQLHTAQPALLSGLIGVLVVSSFLIWRRTPLAGAFACAQVAMLTGLELSARGSSSTAMFTAAGLVLVVGLVQESYGMAYLDELTRMPGRRALNEELLKLGRTYTIGMLDVDHFKKFNDKHGHDVGDQVLRMVASRMKAIGGGGKVFRYGGEEFTIVFANKSPDKAWKHIEALRVSIQDSKLTLRSKDRPKKKPKKKTTKKKSAGTQVSVTVSIGVAQRGGKLKTAHDVMEEADKALYRAKKKGRNQVCK